MCACSLVLPHPMTVDSLDARSCSLELDRSRQRTPCERNAAGSPTLAIIRLAARSSGDSAIDDRSLVEFSIDASPANASNRSRDTWRIDLLHTPSPQPSPRRLADGDLIYLWNLAARRYLRVSPSDDAVAGTKHRSRASVLVLYKADVIDPNRWSTCDDRLRDGDYVYIRALKPSTWLTVSDGALQVASLEQSSQKAAAVRPAGASAADQRCRTDERNQLLCGWMPSCPRP